MTDAMAQQIQPDGEAVLARHQLRRRLRAARVEAGLSQQEAATKLEWSLSKLVRIENGQIGVSRGNLRELRELYDLADAGEVAELVDLARKGRRQPWGRYRRVLHPEHLVYLGYELAASRLRVYQPFLVPDLLQTEAYAWALIRRLAPPEASYHALRQQLEVRMSRQRILERDGGPQMDFLVDEAVLHRRVGAGVHGQVIADEQTQRLADLANRPALTVRVVPFDYPVRDGMDAPFVLLDFEAGERVLYLERACGAAALRHDPATIACHEQLFTHLRQATAASGGVAGFLTISHER